MENKYMPYEDWEFIGETIEKSNWIFAKTMPQNPHYYMLRKESIDSEFVRFVQLIRKYGYKYKFANYWYTQLNVGKWYYWTMGCPLHNCAKTGTILINRKERRLGLESPYDEIAPDYESYFPDEISKDEDIQIADFISRHNLNGNTLEIGCGTGMVTRNLYFKRDGYLGIDPSYAMLKAFRHTRELTGLRTEHTDFESFYTGEKFDFIFATYGAASYVRPEYWSRMDEILNKGGTFLLMFYESGYFPATHIFSNMGILHYTVSDFPKELAADTRQTSRGNYAIIEGIKR